MSSNDHPDQRGPTGPLPKSSNYVEIKHGCPSPLPPRASCGKSQPARRPDQPIQIDFNFNIDLEELGQLSEAG
jgi:hypothetical protein